MASINLLPWREQLREERRREFLTGLAGVAVVAALIWMFVHVLYGQWIDNQENRNNILKQEIASLDRQIAEIKDLKSLKESLMARMGIIQELQANRPRVVHLFDEFVKVPPKGVYFKTIQLQGNQLTMDGVAVSNTNISQLMRNINRSDYVTSPVLLQIKTEPLQGQQVSQFTLQSEVSAKPAPVAQVTGGAQHGTQH